MRLTIIFLLGLGAWAQTNPVALTVNTASPSYTIPPDFLGLSFETGSLTSTPSTFPAENAQFRVMVSQLGVGWVRFGGNSVDKTNWIGGQRSSQTPAASLTASDFDRVAAFARATGWRVLWGMRLANGSPTIDAAEADYVITSASDVLSGLEIGNEPDLFSNNGYTPATLPDYLTAWGQYAAAIQAVHPKAILTGPAAAGNISTWTTQFGVKYGTQISLLTQHYYPLGPVGVVQAGAPNEATISNMLNSTTHGNAQSQGLALSQHRDQHRHEAEDPVAHGGDQLLLQRRSGGRERHLRLHTLGTGLHAYASRHVGGGSQLSRRRHGGLYADRGERIHHHCAAALLLAADVRHGGARPGGSGHQEYRTH